MPKQAFIKTNLTRLILVLLLASAVSCSPKISSNTGGPISGADRDDHGCIGTAGYTWSQLKNDCIRLWEAGIPLDNAQDKLASTVAYIVLADDNKTIELFLPESSLSILLERKGANWSDTDNRYSLSQSTDQAYQLHNSKGILLYENNK